MVSTFSSSPSINTSNSDNATQQILMQAMMANMKPEQQAQLQAALAQQQKKMNNKKYLKDCIRKIGPTLTNGISTQAYALNTPMTFNLNTALNGYVEGIIIRVVLNYNLAAGTGATYALTAAGKLGILDTIEVRYNKSQAKFRLFALRQLALAGALPEWTIPDTVMTGQSDTTLNSYLNPTMPVATGAQTTNLEVFVPFNLINALDARGILPLMAGDTGVQVIVNTPQSLIGSLTVVNNADPVANAIVWTGGTGPGISAISGTVSIEAVYRDGDVPYSTNKVPFDISAVDGTFQMQIDQVLSPLVAGTVQRTKLNIMGYHYYVILLVIDAVQATALATQNNIVYIESAKDGIGGNVFWKYGLQTNMAVQEFQFLNRMNYAQDLDPGAIPMFMGPLQNVVDKSNRDGNQYLDNTRNGWADWRYGVQVTSVGNFGLGPRIEPHVFYVNPVGLVPVGS